MNEDTARGYEGWAIVEIFGHQKYAGRISTETIGAACMLRVDVPELPPRQEEVTGRYSYHPETGTQLPKGTIISYAAVQGYTKFFGVAAIYAITPTTEEAALEAIEGLQPRPVLLVKLPKQAAAIAASADSSADDEDEEDEEEEEEDDGPSF